MVNGRFPPVTQASLGDEAFHFARELDWNLLRTFMVVVESASITLAARQLGLKQPSVSNALKRLESSVGQTLIERSASHFRVTTAGKSLYRECVEIHGTILRLGQELRHVSDEVDEHVNLVMASHVQSPLLDAALADFHTAHPKATISIEVMPSVEAQDRVGHRSASFAICLVGEMSPLFEYRRLYREHFALYCGPSHALFGVEGLKAGDLAGHASVTFATDQASNLLRSVSDMRVAAGLDQRIVGCSSNLEEVRRMIIAGMGIGPLPVHVMQRDVQDGLLWQLPPYADLPPIDVHVVYNRKTRLNRAESSLLDSLLAAIQATSVVNRTYGNEAGVATGDPEQSHHAQVQQPQ